MFRFYYSRRSGRGCVPGDLCCVGQSDLAAAETCRPGNSIFDRLGHRAGGGVRLVGAPALGKASVFHAVADWHAYVDVSWIPRIAGRVGRSAAGFGGAHWRVSGCRGGGSHNLSLVPASPRAEIGAFSTIGSQMLAGVARRQHLFRGGFPNPERDF